MSLSLSLMLQIEHRQTRAVLYSLDTVVGDIHTHQVVVSALLSHALLARILDFWTLSKSNDLMSPSDSIIELYGMDYN